MTIPPGTPCIFKVSFGYFNVIHTVSIRSYFNCALITRRMTQEDEIEC